MIISIVIIVLVVIEIYFIAKYIYELGYLAGRAEWLRVQDEVGKLACEIHDKLYELNNKEGEK